jgi:hypothetical protein
MHIDRLMERQRHCKRTIDSPQNQLASASIIVVPSPGFVSSEWPSGLPIPLSEIVSLQFGHKQHWHNRTLGL